MNSSISNELYILNLGLSKEATMAHPLAIQSYEFKVLARSFLPKTPLIASCIIGIRVASPTSSIVSILLSGSPHLPNDSLRHLLKFYIKVCIKASRSLLSTCLLKSWSSINESTLISASLLPLSNFLSFSILSMSLSLHLTFCLGSHPYFF